MRLILSLAILSILQINTCLAQTQNWGLSALFSIVRYQNTACQTPDGETGICVLETECNNRQGQINGGCPTQALVCCVSKFTCGQSTSANETIFMNPSYPRSENITDTCQVTIEKPSNVCQLRLDFEEFTLAQPDLNGLCTTDSFMVRTTVGERLPILCGENGGQHLYIDVGRGSANPVVLSIISNGNHISRTWKIKISTIPCNNLMAPSGCLQYYRSPSDVVKSFNYGIEPNPAGGARYLANMRYSTCIRLEENFCAIKWQPDHINGFNFGTIKSKVNETEFLEHGSGDECSSDDFVTIDQASSDGIGSGFDRFCGNKLLAYDYLISRSKPFQLKVTTNLEHEHNSRLAQNGFALRYVQLPCVY